MAKVTIYIEGAKMSAEKEVVQKLCAAIEKAGAKYVDPLMGYSFTPQLPETPPLVAADKSVDNASKK